MCVGGVYVSVYVCVCCGWNNWMWLLAHTQRQMTRQNTFDPVSWAQMVLIASLPLPLPLPVPLPGLPWHTVCMCVCVFRASQKGIIEVQTRKLKNRNGKYRRLSKTNMAHSKLDYHKLIAVPHGKRESEREWERERDGSHLQVRFKRFIRPAYSWQILLVILVTSSTFAFRNVPQLQATVKERK